MGVKELFQPKYMRYSAEEFAKDNDILYVPFKDTELKRVPREKGTLTNSFLLIEGRFIIMRPPDDGMPTRPINFYRRTKRGRCIKVLDNQRAFYEIVNLSEILLQMTELYERHFHDQIFLDSMSFAVKLVDHLSNQYKGRGELAITDDTLCNNNVPPNKQNDARKVFYNEFVDHFMGWNFGRVVSENDRLRDELSRLVRMLEEAGIREDAGPGFDVWMSEYVWHIKYDKGGVKGFTHP